MKTIFIDLNIIPELRRDLVGFVLSQGYNFRQIERVNADGTNSVLVIEAGNKTEEKALNAFLKKAKLSVSMVVENDGKAGKSGKKLGTFREALTPSKDKGFFKDKTTGKTFEVV
jgi:hypothetical protein